jgi:hypothetical protein
MLTNTLSNTALVFLNYPLQVLLLLLPFLFLFAVGFAYCAELLRLLLLHRQTFFKSSKVIPVMIGRVLILGKRYL